MWEGRKLPPCLGSATTIQIFFIFLSFAKMRMTNISAFPRIEMTLMGMIEILVCYQYFKYCEQDNEDPCVLYSDHYVANLCRFFIERTNILIK